MTKPVSFALVLGAAVRPGNVPSPTLRRRADHGARLYLSGTVAGIVASGAARLPGVTSEAAAIADICRAAGVPRAAVYVEDQACSTEDNLRLCAPILRKHAEGRVVLVTDLWHMPRARLVARRQGLQVSCAPVPLKGAKPLSVIRGVLRETAAFVVYWVQGRGR